jgi:hypothetical protein
MHPLIQRKIIHCHPTYKNNLIFSEICHKLQGKNYYYYYYFIGIVIVVFLCRFTMFPSHGGGSGGGCLSAAPYSPQSSSASSVTPPSSAYLGGITSAGPVYVPTTRVLAPG